MLTVTSCCFISNVQCVRLAAGRRTQADDATDQWRDQWNAATVCPTQWRSPALDGWLSWIVDVDRPSAEGHPKQSNRLDSSPGCLGATCQARWTWRSRAAGTSVCSSLQPQRLALWQLLSRLQFQNWTPRSSTNSPMTSDPSFSTAQFVWAVCDGAPSCCRVQE